MNFILKTLEFTKQLVNTFLSLIKILIKSKFTTTLPKAETDTCIVLGNGPSLKKSLVQYQDVLTKLDLLCVNNFSITQEYELLKPKYYVLLDPAYFAKTPLKVVEDCFNNIKTKTSWELILLVPTQAKQSPLLQQLCLDNTHVKLICYNYVPFKGFNNIGHYLFKKRLAMPQSQNVLVASLFLGINLGFKKIYLLGADHTWHVNLHVNEKNELCLKDEHFYQKENGNDTIILYKENSKTETVKLHEAFLSCGKAFEGHYNVNKYAILRNVNIYNSSDVSFIDAYVRKPIVL